MMQVYYPKIGGRPEPTSEIALISNPYDGQPVARVGVATRDQVLLAIAGAESAFATLRRLPTHERARLLEAVAEGLGQRAAEFAELIARESGKPIRYARAEVSRAVVTFTLAAAECRTERGEVLPIDLSSASEGRLCLYRRVPSGPVAAIAPFNFPLNLVAHKLAPALAVGAPVVLKPAQQAPATAHLLSDVLDHAGAPPGAFSVVHCGPEIGETLVRDDRLRVLSFTGSADLGFRLKALAGKKRVILELGGNAPCVVDEGVELAAVVPRIAEAAWANAGQVCIKAQRVFVHGALFEQFLEAFLAETARLAWGDPLDERTVIGPLIEARHVERVLDWIHEAERGGARVLSGARAEGRVVLPTVLTGTTPEMRVCREEVFGPVTVVEPADDFDAALAAANAGRYGLQAGVFTPRLDHALRAYDVLDFGSVLINDAPAFRVDNYPYGGVKDSGLGREGVRFAMQELSEPKLLVLRA